MRLNTLEKWVMNNPVRAAIQRHVEARRLQEMGGMMSGGRALEIGCGRGVGVEIILDRFRADSVDGLDLDPDMVARARRRLRARIDGGSVRLWTGSATAIEAEDAYYDAVFDFGIIHHIPMWREAIAEVWRVLAPGGRFYAEEVLDRLIRHPIAMRLFEHPLKDRFDHDGFRDALCTAGFEIVATRELGGAFAWFVADKPHTAQRVSAAQLT